MAQAVASLGLLLCASSTTWQTTCLASCRYIHDSPRLSVCRLFGMPDDDAALRVIEHNPDVVMEVTSNRHLSLW